MYRYIKRIFDVIISVVGCIVLAIPMIIIALIIKIDSPGPVFFKQRRIGVHKKEFQIIYYHKTRLNTVILIL